MSDEIQAPNEQTSKPAPKDHISDLQLETVPPFALALELLFPLGTPRARLTAFFGNRVTSRAVRLWRAGQRKPPQWAIDAMHAHHARLGALLEAAKPSDPQAGTKALHRWRHEQRAKKNAR